jgi:hypothetical protein
MVNDNGVTDGKVTENFLWNCNFNLHVIGHRL